MMTWPKIVILTFYAVSTLVTISQIGKPKKPTTPSVAAASMVIIGLIAWLVVIA